MKKIAVFYHTFLFRNIPPVQSDSAVAITREQMQVALPNYGLLEAANEFHVGINGGVESQILAQSIIPPKATINYHGLHSKSELCTMRMLQEWLKGHEDWYVCYWHVKGGTYPLGDPWGTVWRHCMQVICIKEWKRCIEDLDAGYESVGAHWLTPESFPGMIGTPIWGGNFWWAKASFLSELPMLPETSSNYWLSEGWIGSGRRPKVKDYHPQWPNWPGCLTTRLNSP